jgi:cysteine synthase A
MQLLLAIHLKPCKSDTRVMLLPTAAAAGAEVVRLRPVSITHPEHPVNVARQKAADTPGAVFADQFENLANLRAHLDTGGLAIWELCATSSAIMLSGTACFAVVGPAWC